MDEPQVLGLREEASAESGPVLVSSGSQAVLSGSEIAVVTHEGDVRVVRRLEPAKVKPRIKSLRIAMIGARGVPATFGGVEHHVEELGSRLAARGHEVTVFSRSNYVEDRRDEYRGMKLRHLPTVGTKHLDAIVHSTISTLDAMRRGFDVIHYHAVGPGIPAMVPRLLSRSKVALTVHGLDGDRAKWGSGAQKVLKMAEWLSAKVPNATIAVSNDLANHYSDRYSTKAWHVPNGVHAVESKPADEITKRFGLKKGNYVLFVGRMVPEKAPDALVRAFHKLPGDVRLVMAGDSSYTNEFVQSLRREAGADERVIFPGYVYGDTLNELYSNAGAFVLPSYLEGLPLTLLEAISYGAPVITSDIPPHLEILGHDGPGHRLFPCGDEDALVAALREAFQNQDLEQMGAQVFKEEVLRRYCWDSAAEATEEVYEHLVK